MAPSASHTAAVKSKCNTVKEGLQQSECPDRVKRMLCASLSSTVGTPSAERHPFSEKFVNMIEQVLKAEISRLEGEVASKDAAFKELSPAKATREAALEQAKTEAGEKATALAEAKKAVADANAAVKAATAEVKATKKAQAEGDVELEKVSEKKTALEGVINDSLVPIVDGTAEEATRKHRAKTVVDTGRSYGFDGSLMNTAATLLEKSAEERGEFDKTCIQQVQDAFAAQIKIFDDELAAGAPGKAERAGAVEKAEADKAAAEATQTDAKEKASAAQEAKSAADSEQKAAAKSLNDFMPDLKHSGDALDAAKKDLQNFLDGSQAAFNELKVFEENAFTKLPYYEMVDGYKCDRAVLQACRDSVNGGATPGRVSEDDAKAVFAVVADGGKVTACERWTVRYCLTEFKWTDTAQTWMHSEMAKVHQDRPAKKPRVEGKSFYQQVDGMRLDRGIIDACKEATEGEGKDGKVSKEDAEKVWAAAADGVGVTDTERWTLRYCLGLFDFSPPAHDYLVEQIAALGADGA